ncbi:DNA-3-methyladenine glycosylase [Marisediminicola sp. LYQ85]|uniref:DNA-3-methyladenine glycosylase n=1 Tax=Marisediminicola sp. LYQ85 TaxID=3391062 RepID=UPI0039839733
MFDHSLLEQGALAAAPALLGVTIRHGDVAVRLTEVEAYLGEGDPGSHSFRGRTPRTAVMFDRPGRLYTYFSYGMHTCANIVCSPVGIASAVLIRAGEVVDGIDVARSRRATSKGDDDLARGPARLAAALGITLEHGGADLETGPVTLDFASRPAAGTDIRSGPRTGVAMPGGSDVYPWRFWFDGDPTVSPYRRHVPRRRERAPVTPR